MSKILLVESDRFQTRVAVLEEARPVEILVEYAFDRGAVGNIYKGRVTRVLPGIEAAFVDIGLGRDAFLYAGDAKENSLAVDDADADVQDGVGEVEIPAPSIESLVRTGQEILVHLSLPGRWLVLLPTVRQVGVSRRIDGERERERLRAELEQMAGERFGLIARTAAQDRSSEEFGHDLEYLLDLWASIRERAERTAPPALLHRDLDLSLRVVRDILSDEFSVVWTSTEELNSRIQDFLRRSQPDLVERVRAFEGEEPLFERFGIERELNGVLRSKVWLKSGGHIVINSTEALVAIDVNTGRYLGKDDLEETVVKTNLEAAKEIARQLRLRDLGGIIVVDFIDMIDPENRGRVVATLEEELTKDRAKSQLLPISEFGLVQITRKRSRVDLQAQLTRSCPRCDGHGRLKSARVVCLDIRRSLLRRRTELAESRLVLSVEPEVAAALLGPLKGVVDELEQALAAGIEVKADTALEPEQFEVTEA